MPASQSLKNESVFGGSDTNVQGSRDRPCEWERPYHPRGPKVYIREGPSSGLWWLGSRVLPYHIRKTKLQVEMRKDQVSRIHSALMVHCSSQSSATNDVELVGLHE